MNRKYFAGLFSIALLITFVVVGCGGSGGGGNPASPVISDGQLANLSGTVNFDGKPVANAKVHLYPSDKAHVAGLAQISSNKRMNVLAQTLGQDGSYYTTSNALGQYSFKSIPVGEYTLVAIKDQNHQYAKTGVILGSVTQLDAELTPTGSVTGYVKSSNNSVPGAIVYLDGTSYVAVTGVDGSYIISNVPANQSFSVKVISGHGELESSPSVTVAPGQMATVQDLILSVPATPTVPFAVIRGTISVDGVTAPDTALANNLILLSADNQAPLINVTDEEGVFSFTVFNEGAYRITPIPEEADVVPLYQEINATLDSEVTLSEVFVYYPDEEESGFSVGGDIIKVAKAFNESNEAGVPLILVSTDADAAKYATVSGPDGGFHFNVPAGEYNLSVGGGYDFETTLTENPIGVTADYFFTDPIRLVPTNLKFKVEGTLVKNESAFGETDNSGVALSLTSTDASNRVYPAVTDLNGNFSFEVPPGEYELAVGGAYEFDPAQTGNVIVVQIANDYAFANTIGVKPSLKKMFHVTGRLNKLSPAFGETTDGDVPVYLEDVGQLIRTQATLTDPQGYFSFAVPAGDYELKIGGHYEFQTIPAPITLTGDHDYGELIIRPASQIGGRISGALLPTSAPGMFEVRIEEVAQAYVDVKFVSPSTGRFAFDNVPPGDYRVFVLPSQNGFYGESAQVSLNPGQELTGADVNSFPQNPNITAATADLVAVSITGNRFESSPVDPVETRIFVDGIELSRPGGYVPSDTADEAEVLDVVPGPHKLTIVKSWQRPGGTEVYHLHSNDFMFDKPVGAPSNLQVAKVADTHAAFSWQNARFAEATDIEIQEVSGGITVKTDIVNGNFYECDGLTPGVSYRAFFKNIAKNQISTAVTVDFTTKTTEELQINSFVLAGSDSTPDPQNFAPVGFETLNDELFVCYLNSETEVQIHKFAADGSYSGNSIATPTMSADNHQVTMAVGAGRVFMAHYSSMGMELNVYSANDLSFINGKLFSGSIPEGSLLYADNKLFFAYTESLTNATHNLIEIDTTNLSTLTTITSVSQTLGFLSVGNGHHIKACADETYLYFAYPVSVFSMVFDAIQIERVPLSNTAQTPEQFAVFMVNSGSGSGDDMSVRQFKCGNGKLYLRAFDAYMSMHKLGFIDVFSGYVEDRSSDMAFEGRGDYGADGRGRVWMLEADLAGNNYSFVNIKAADIGRDALIINEPAPGPVGAFYFSNPAEFIKIDSSTDSMNMLYRNKLNELAVYRYSSSY